MMNIGAGPTKVRLMLARTGESVVLKSPDHLEDDGDDPLNNSVETTESYTPKAGSEEQSSILCSRFYESDPSTEESNTGSVTEDRPRLAFPTHGTSVDPKEEDRVEYQGITYELKSPRYYGTWVSFEAINVNEQKVD